MEKLSEHYITFEESKMLKDFGFDAYCHRFYHSRDGKKFIIQGISGDDDMYLHNVDPDNWYPCPTLDLVVEWLRKKYDIYFKVNYYRLDVGDGWCNLQVYKKGKNGCEISYESYDYHDICHSAIIFCLENLITKDFI